MFNSPFCFERISFANQGWATVQALRPFRASQRFGYRGLDCTSDPCIVIVRKMQATRSACLLRVVLWLDVGSYVTNVKGPPCSCGQQDGCRAGERSNLPKKPLRSGLLRNSSGTIDQTRLVTLMLTSRCVTVSRPPVFSNGTILVTCSTGCGQTMPEALVAFPAGPGKEGSASTHERRVTWSSKQLQGKPSCGSRWLSS